MCGYNFAYDGIATITKCYYLEGCNAVGTSFSCTEGTSISLEQFESGAVCEFVGYHSPQASNDFKCIHCEKYDEPKKVSDTHHSELNITHKDYYAIENASQLYWFAGLVNGDSKVCTGSVNKNTGAKAVLTADITVNTDVLNENGELNATNANTFKEWTPIGNEDNKYTGTFDGNGKTISGLYFHDSGANYVGLFGYSSGTIKNVGVVDPYFNGKENVGGVCGYNNGGTIENCYNRGTVSGSSNCVGGVCGFSTGTITNCYNTGDVGGVCGANSGTITNCYCLDSQETPSNDGTTFKTTEQFASGEVCYLLNNGKTDGSQVWYQTINSDSYPLLDNSHGTVYACTPCTGVFSNTSGQHADHTYIVDTENGKQHKCEKCGETHNAVFTANDDTDTISVCCDHGTITLNAPTENLTYDGTAKAATVTGVIEGFDTPKILYKLKYSEAAAVETAPVNAGTYVASITYTDADYNKHSVSVEYTIEKAELTVEAGTYKVSKEYDETTGAGTGSGTLSVSGIINDDDVTVKVDSVGEYSASDVGNDYKVAVAISLSGDKADNYTLGTVSSINVPAAITKAEQTADVIDPVVEKFDCCSVTLAKVDGYEYSMDGKTWQDSNVFIGLTAGTKYTFYQRIKATANYEASANSTGVLQTTSKHDYSDENAKPEAFYKKATCTSPAVYYFSCSKCGDVEEDSTHTFTNGSVLEHNDTDNDNRCDTCGHIMDGIGAKLAGHSLTLDGSVGVNFYMELSSEVISDSNAYMEFTLPGGKTSTVKVSEAPTEVISGTTYYKFKCQVNATAMTDTITAQIKSTVGNSKVYEYTVKEYADYLFAHKDESTEFAEAAELIEAMVNYGSYAQIYAGYNTEKLAVGDAKNLKSLDDVWISEYYEPSIYETKVQFAGANLSLLSTTTLRMYFQLIDVEANEVRFGYQGQLLEMKQSGDYYYVELVGIPASKLDDEFRIDVLEGSTNFVVTYTPMAYCTSVVTRPTTETRTESLKNLIKALVMYNQAADAYISEN